jgi:hypothetical protein
MNNIALLWTTAEVLNTLMVTGKPGRRQNTLLLSNILKGVAKQQYKYFLSADEAKNWDILKEAKGAEQDHQCAGVQCHGLFHLLPVSYRHHF